MPERAILISLRKSPRMHYWTFLLVANLNFNLTSSKRSFICDIEDAGGTPNLLGRAGFHFTNMGMGAGDSVLESDGKFPEKNP